MSFKLRPAPWGSRAGPSIFFLMAAVDMLILSLAPMAKTDAKKADTNHRFFRTEKDQGLFKAERDPGPSVPPLSSSPVVVSDTRGHRPGRTNGVRRCSGQALFT